MKKFLLLISLLSAQQSPAQTLVSYELIETYTTIQVDSILAANGIPGIILPSSYDIDIYKVIYHTVDTDTLPVIASGALFIPKNPECLVPLMSYQHGTIAVKTQVPSTLGGLEVLIGETSASDGAVVAMPDYVGLGDSPGLHPYIHAYTEARATADLLVAAVEICDELVVTRNDQLFLLGYSQGGHATMAAHQLIQQDYSDHFSVTASTPMSGPYDVSGIQAQVIASDIAYPNPAYLPYFLLAYNEAYSIFPSVSDFFISPYDSILPPLFDGTHDLDEISALMPDTPNKIIVPAVLDSFITFPDYRLYDFLSLNNTYEWMPQSPVRMYYCEGDQDVNYQNALVAYESFTNGGSTLVTAQSSGAAFDHAGCVFPSLLKSKEFFDSLRIDVIKITIDVQPASSATASDGILTAHASSGYPPYTYNWSNGATDSVNENIPPGFYTLTVTDATGCKETSAQFLGVQVGVEQVMAAHTKIFPNPLHQVAYIQFPEESRYSIEIADASGQVTMRDQFFGQEYILLRNHFSTGVYFVKLQKEEGFPYVKMLVVQ
jgi:hypothetical protein